jgi:hypothetical protein
MKKTNSIIEEALIEASQLEEAVKEIGKEVLASAMKQEIDEIIKSSLTEEEEVESPEIDSMGVEMPEMPEMPEMGDDMDDDISDDEEVMDMTQSSDDEVIKVFKAMKPEDSIEVTKTEDGLHLKDGDNEYILQMEGVKEMTDEELDEYLDEATFEDFDDLDIELEDEDEDEDDDEIMYELEMDEESMGKHMSSKNSDMSDESLMDEDEQFEGWMKEMMDEYSEEEEEVMYEIELSEEEEVIDEDKDEDDKDDDLEEAARTYGFGSKDGSRGLRKAITNNRNYSYGNGVKVESLRKKLSLVESELNNYKAKNEDYKKALSTLKDKMNEMAVYYTNLSYTNKLFTEHTTTKKEKLDILKRFDNAKNINESKSLFGVISGELSSKKIISNLGDLSENVDKSLNSSSSKLTESIVYEDPKIKQIKELMLKLSPSRK